MKRYFVSAMLVAAAISLSPIESRADRWHLEGDGIAWTVAPSDTHFDHVEMSGKNVSTVLRYGVNPDGTFSINKSMVWPMLRIIPNNTSGCVMRRFAWDPLDAVTVNGRSLETNEKVKSVSLRESLNVESECNNGYYGTWTIARSFFPSRELPTLVEKYTVTNTGKKTLRVEIPEGGFTMATDPKKGVKGSYNLVGSTKGAGVYDLEPGQSVYFSAQITGLNPGEAPVIADAEEELTKRRGFVDEMMSTLVLETPDPVINRMMDYAKVRGCESIFATHGGPMHGPGGESYYAAIWANDQAEYIDPFFPFTGYEYGNESALNSFRHFARFMNDDYKCIPSSIIAEGDDIWNGAGDRGDCAMIAYGAARYALARADSKEAEELWPLITWCLEYCRRNINEEGVVASDSDELEGRFPSGDANLCTSSLYYDALLSASYLAKELKKPGADDYAKQAAKLRKNIDKYFAHDVEGFDTYAYYKGNDVLRAWICIPLVMGIDERAKGTIDALFSPRLWTENGLLSQAGDKTFWDRSTLYALRGVYAVGEGDRATDYMKRYSRTRLLGDHVPYAIEAWPEGSQRHLSAESGLYARIITEGMFGIRPTGFKSFTLKPTLPSEWPDMALRHIKAFGEDFDVEVSRTDGGKLLVKVINDGKVQKYTIQPGKEINVKL